MKPCSRKWTPPANSTVRRRAKGGQSAQNERIKSNKRDALEGARICSLRTRAAFFARPIISFTSTDSRKSQHHERLAPQFSRQGRGRFGRPLLLLEVTNAR